jgi:hypothetical protein
MEIILFSQIQIVAILQRAGEFILLQEVQAECLQINPDNVPVQTIMKDEVPVLIHPIIHIHHQADQAGAVDQEVMVVPAAVQEVQAVVIEEGDNLYEMYFNPLKKSGVIYYEI